MVFNLNIVDLTIVITSWNKSYFINKKIIVPLNYLQFHYVQNSSNKNYKIRWNIIRNKIAVRVNLIHLKLIFEKKILLFTFTWTVRVKSINCTDFSKKKKTVHWTVEYCSALNCFLFFCISNATNGGTNKQ
jgi:hypothetical protein